ncbi:hypothetical protein JB92DRAFT_3092258 [Gautieria morchelliformis]|nr:hypothetical protein JB92DRAFT_3092258 [Gautieria morchelliformis]
MLPAAFEPMDDVAEVGDEFTWRLLKASRSHLSLHREVPDGYDFVDAKGGKSKGWQEMSRKRLSSIIRELKGKDASTSKPSASEAELDDEPIHSHNTRSKKKRTSISPVPEDNYDDDFQSSSDIEKAHESNSVSNAIYVVSSDSEEGSPLASALPIPQKATTSGSPPAKRLSTPELEKSFEDFDASMKTASMKPAPKLSGFKSPFKTADNPWANLI